MSILDTLVKATQKRLLADQSRLPLKEMMALAKSRIARPFIFEETLKKEGLHFICEVKKASPSKGVIAHDFPYLEIAKDYEAAGAAAISVLTETDYFLGKDAYLSEIAEVVKTPLLRKDFTIDPYQIHQARAIGADAILLIAALLSVDEIKTFIQIADELGLSHIVEAHTEAEVKAALSAHARVIGVNNRNLKTFELSLETSIRLKTLVPKDTLFIAESGIASHEDVAKLAKHGISTFLVGESFMRAPDKKAMLKKLRGEL